MNVKILVISAILLSGYSACAQWNLQTSPTQSSIYDIHFNSATTGFVASGNVIHRTMDGGNSWAQPAFTGSAIELEVLINASIFDIHFVDSQKGFLAGGGFFNTYDIIARTLDGGATWSLVYYTPVPGSFLRESMNSITFVNSTTGFAVGGKGRVVKTTDGGATWTDINLSTTQDLNTVYFPDTQTGFIGGKNVLFKTVNGGNTWTAVNVTPYDINDFHFYDASSGIASTSEGTLLITHDAGNSWTPDPMLKFDYPLTKIEFSGSAGYILANNASYQTFILTTSDQGATWQTQNFPTGYGMYGLHATGSAVWAGGYAGKLYKTTNGGGEVFPIAVFSASAPKLCENQSVTFQNHGYAHYTYEWRVDGVLKSTNYNYTTTLTQGDHTIELTAIHGTQKGKTSMAYYVEPDAAFKEPIDVTYTDGICAGSKTTIRVYELEWGTYKLYQDNVEIAGTEGYPYHYFQTPALTQTTTFTVQVTRSNSCASFEKTKDIVVTVHPFPTTGSTIAALQPDICNEGQTSVKISNSKANVRYDLYRTKNDWQPIVSVTGNGGNAVLPTPVLRDTTQYLVKASIINGSCTNWFDDTVRVNVEKVVASFELSLVNTPSGEPVPVTNNSSGAINFSWNFSSASNPQASTLPAPGTVIFTGSGKHPVTLHASSASGCSHSAERSITIYDPATMDRSCWAAEIAYMGEDLFSPEEEHIDIETAPNDDLLLTGGHEAMSFQSESLGKFEIPGSNTWNEFLARYSPEGVLKWIIPNTGVGTPTAGRLAASADGSIYIHGSGFENPVFYSVDGTSIKKEVSDNLSSKYFILKYSSTGKLIWVKSFEELQIPIDWHYVYAIETDAQGNLYVANDQVTKISPAGEHQWTTEKLLLVHEQDYEKGRFTVAGDGSWYFLKRNQPLELSHYSKDGVLKWKYNIPYSGFGDLPAETRLGSDDAGNLIFMYSDVWKSVLQLPDPTVSADPSSLWLIKFAQDGSIIWANKSRNLVICNDFEVSRNGNVNLLLNLYTWQLPDLKTSLQSQDGNDIQLDFTGHTPHLITYAPNGVTLRSRPMRDPAGQGECVMFNTDLAAYNNGIYAIGFPNCESIINGDIIYGNWDTPGPTLMYLAKFDLDCNNISQKFDVSITDNPQDQHCAGSSIQVNYLISGPAYENSVFKVYLSDEWGYTTRNRSTLIGTLESSNTSGTIEAVIPDDVVWGVPYYIRVVVDRDPELYSTIIPINKYLSSDFTPDFDYYLNDLSVTLTAKGRPGIHYTWVITHYQTGETVTISGDYQEAASITHRVPETGNYSLLLTVTDECGNTGTIDKGLLYIPCENYAAPDFTYTIDKKTVTFTAVVDETRTNTYAWIFGDGTTSSEKNPVHTYATYGTKGIGLSLTNECSGGGTARSIELPCPSIDPKITYAHTPGEKTVTFTYAGISDLPAESTYLWTFGDGSSSTAKNPQYTYASYGNFNVSLTETNECNSKTVWITAAVTCPRPVLDFNSAAQNTLASFTSSFQGSTSVHWNFGDGTSQETSGTSVNHSYAAAGTYQVCLSATNACGTEEVCKTLVITCPMPEAGFVYEITSGTSVTFSNQSVNHDHVLWSFGDGGQSDHDVVVRDFEPGTYQVCLEAENACGKETSCQEIVIIITGRESALSNSIVMYPNPVVTDNLLLRAEQMTIDRVEVLAGTGIQVYDVNFDSPKKEVGINTQAWKSGEYIITITAGREKLTRKVVKK